MASARRSPEIDLGASDLDASTEVVELDDARPAPAPLRLLAGPGGPAEVPYRRERDDPGSLAGIWEAVARS